MAKKNTMGGKTAGGLALIIIAFYLLSLGVSSGNSAYYLAFAICGVIGIVTVWQALKKP